MLYTEVLVTKSNVYQISQIVETNNTFSIVKYPEKIITRVDFSSIKNTIDKIKSEGIKTKNGFMLFTSDRLENAFLTAYNFPKYNRNDIIETLNSSQSYFYRAVGYCAYHKRYITKQQLKQKNCLIKQCNRLIQLRHNFWYDKELKSCFKKLKKLKIEI